MMVEKIRSVIVEDESAAREVLKNYLGKYCPQVEVVGEAHNFKEAIPVLHALNQQLINQVIFNRNKIIVENFREKQPEKQQVILPTLEGFEVVKMEEIVRLKGNGNFTDLFLANGSKKMVCRFLKHFSEILPFPFIRVHKSHIINIHFVKAYNKGGYVTMNDDSEIEVSGTYKEGFLRLLK